MWQEAPRPKSSHSGSVGSKMALQPPPWIALGGPWLFSPIPSPSQIGGGVSLELADTVKSHGVGRYFRRGCIQAGRRKESTTLTLTPGHIRQLAPGYEPMFQETSCFLVGVGHRGGREQAAGLAREGLRLGPGPGTKYPGASE